MAQPNLRKSSLAVILMLLTLGASLSYAQIVLPPPPTNPGPDDSGGGNPPPPDPGGNLAVHIR